MTTTWRIASMCAFIPLLLAALSLLSGCDDDVDTPPWLANYTASGYAGKGGASGNGGGDSGGAKGGGAQVSAGGSSGEGGDGS